MSSSIPPLRQIKWLPILQLLGGLIVLSVFQVILINMVLAKMPEQEGGGRMEHQIYLRHGVMMPVAG